MGGITVSNQGWLQLWGQSGAHNEGINFQLRQIHLSRYSKQNIDIQRTLDDSIDLVETGLKGEETAWNFAHLLRNPFAIDAHDTEWGLENACLNVNNVIKFLREVADRWQKGLSLFLEGSFASKEDPLANDVQLIHSAFKFLEITINGWERVTKHYDGIPQARDWADKFYDMHDLRLPSLQRARDQLEAAFNLYSGMSEFRSVTARSLLRGSEKEYRLTPWNRTRAFEEILKGVHPANQAELDGFASNTLGLSWDQRNSIEKDFWKSRLEEVVA